MAKKSAVLRQKDSERGLDAKLFLGRNGGTKLFDLGKLAQNLNLRGLLVLAEDLGNQLALAFRLVPVLLEFGDDAPLVGLVKSFKGPPRCYAALSN